VKRLHLSARDTVLWLGILNQIRWKLRAGGAAADESEN